MGGAASGRGARLAAAVGELRDELRVEPVRDTTVLRVTYVSRDPELSARVLQTLASLFEKKHAEVRRESLPESVLDAQSERYREEAEAEEAELDNFSARAGTRSFLQEPAELERLNQLEAKREGDEAQAYAAQERAMQLGTQANSLPARETTQTKSIDNAPLLAQLESTLLALHLKHSEMLAKWRAGVSGGAGRGSANGRDAAGGKRNAGVSAAGSDDGPVGGGGLAGHGTCEGECGPGGLRGGSPGHRAHRSRLRARGATAERGEGAAKRPGTASTPGRGCLPFLCARTR